MDDVENRTYTNLVSNGRKLLFNPFAYEIEPVKIEVEAVPAHLCSRCDLSFGSKADYKKHIREVHSVTKKYTCYICEAHFTRQAHLRRHLKDAHHPKYSTCPVCFKALKRQDILMQHIKDNHLNKEDVYHCRDCDFTCGNMKELQNHEISHNLSIRHQCPHCSDTFKRRDHMVRHIKCKHMNQFVVCPICQQKYKRKDHVTRHIREKH